MLSLPRKVRFYDLSQNLTQFQYTILVKIFLSPRKCQHQLYNFVRSCTKTVMLICVTVLSVKWFLFRLMSGDPHSTSNKEQSKNGISRHVGPTSMTIGAKTPNAKKLTIKNFKGK